MKQRTCERERNRSRRRVSLAFATNQRDKFENTRNGEEKRLVESTCRRGTCHGSSSGWRRTVVDRLSMMMRIGRGVSCRDIARMRIESRRRLIGSCRHCCLEGSEDDFRLSRNDVRTKEERMSLACSSVCLSLLSLLYRSNLSGIIDMSLYNEKKTREREERESE